MLISPPVRLASTRWPCPDAGPAARDQRGDDAERRVQAGDQIGDRRAGAHRLAAAAPLTLMKPLMAWAMKSNAGRST